MRQLFVDNIGLHLKRYSVIALGLLVALPAAWEAVPADMRAHLPGWLIGALQTAVAISGLVGALLKQPLKPSEFGLSDNEGGKS